jgi:predicted  nucleic acid-binding Zn-ribbon protein
MIISIMNIDELLRYTKPTTELEIALYNALQEQVTQGSIEAQEEIEELNDSIENLQDEVGSLKNKIEDLEYEILEVMQRSE